MSECESDLVSHKIRVKTASSERGHHLREEVGSVPGEGNGSKTPRAKMAAASPSKRDTVVNINNEGRENKTQLGAVEETLHRMGFNDVTRLTMNPLLDRAPPPPYQDFYPPSAPTHPMQPHTHTLLHNVQYEKNSPDWKLFTLTPRVTWVTNMRFAQEQEEMSGPRKVGIATVIATVMYFFSFLPSAFS